MALFDDCYHRRSQGVQWVHLHPQSEKENFRRNLQEKFVSTSPSRPVHLRMQSKSQFLRHFLLGGEDLEDLVVLDHRRSQGGAVGAPAPPMVVRKIFSGVIYRENV